MLADCSGTSSGRLLALDLLVGITIISHRHGGEAAEALDGEEEAFGAGNVADGVGARLYKPKEVAGNKILDRLAVLDSHHRGSSAGSSGPGSRDTRVLVKKG
jgi:hypothetical protein